MLPVRAEPYPHVVCESFLHPEHYRELCRTFPVCPPGKSPTGFAHYWGEDGYGRLLDEQPAWRALHETFHRQTFIDWGARQFAEVWAREGCTLRDGVTPCNGAVCAADLTSAIQDLAADHPGLALAGVGMGSADHWKLALIDGGRFHGLTSDFPAACPSE